MRNSLHLFILLLSLPASSRLIHRGAAASTASPSASSQPSAQSPSGLCARGVLLPAPEPPMKRRRNTERVQGNSSQEEGGAELAEIGAADEIGAGRKRADPLRPTAKARAADAKSLCACVHEGWTSCAGPPAQCFNVATSSPWQPARHIDKEDLFPSSPSSRLNTSAPPPWAHAFSFYTAACTSCACAASGSSAYQPIDNVAPSSSSDSTSSSSPFVHASSPLNGQALPATEESTEGKNDHLLHVFRDVIVHHPVCRIFSPCIVRGKVVLPKRMHALQDRLRACGISNVVFDDSWTIAAKAHEQRSATTSDSSRTDPSSSSGTKSSTHLFVDRDLFGLGSYRSHFPHFVTDALWIFHAYGLWWTLPDAPPAQHYSRTCYRWDGTQAVEAEAEQCSSSSLPGSLAPLLFMQEGIPDHGWLQDYATMLFARAGGALFVNHILKEPQCYRSMVVTLSDKYVTMSQPYPVVEIHHPFYAHNAMPRAPLSASRRRQYPSAPSQASQTSSACTFNITLVTRKSEFGRELVGAAELAAHLQRLCAKWGQASSDQEEDLVTFASAASGSTTAGGSNRIGTCHVSSVSFEGTSLAHQQQVMQTSDLAIFAHGAAVTNIMFMRFGAAVIEIFPFGYTPQIYAHMANIFGIQYLSSVSPPDDQTFQECLFSRDAADRASGMAVHRDRVYHAWEVAVDAWHKRGALLPLGLERHNFTDGYRRARDCVRLQNLAVNISFVESIVREQRIHYCFSPASL